LSFSLEGQIFFPTPGKLVSEGIVCKAMCKQLWVKMQCV